MYNKVKLSKRQIKEDKFTSFMLNSRQLAQENWQFAVIGAAIIVIAILGISYFATSAEQAKVEAAERFSRALLDFRNGNSQVAILSFSQIVQDYGDDQVAERSIFMLGKINFDQRNYPEAIKYYEMYLAKYPEKKFYSAACLAGIGAVQENQAAYSEAAAKFWEAYEVYPEGPQAGDYLVSAMRTSLAAGDISSAQERLDLIEENFSGTDLATKASRLFAEKSN